MVSRKPLPSSLDLLPIGQRVGDKDLLKCKMKPNERFSHIQAVVDHGKRPPKAVTTNDENMFVTKRKGENFGRMTPGVLERYLRYAKEPQPAPSLSLLDNMRQGLYPPKQPPKESQAAKIVLLDLRSKEEYDMCHIKNAISFPATNIQQDRLFGSLLLFKNKPDKLVVVYMDDERHGVMAARIIFEKGFDNIYLLSGGITTFAHEHPQWVEGFGIVDQDQLLKPAPVLTNKTLSKTNK